MHTSVLLKEAITGLHIEAGDTVLDATIGAAGHAEAILENFKKVKLIGLDVDLDAIERAQARLKAYEGVIFLNTNFRFVDRALEEKGIDHIDRALFDLGVSSYQLGVTGRGISFAQDEPLIMTLASTASVDSLTAKDIVNIWDAQDIENVLKGYGEEKYARRIAEGIVESRKLRPIETTSQLVDIIKKSVPRMYLHGRIHPATKTFQALRIAVNDELDALEEALTKTFDLLTPEGRLAVISFHSLEDRIVKRFIKNKVVEKKGIAIQKKPISATDEERNANPRSRSAKLRILEKI